MSRQVKGVAEFSSHKIVYVRSYALCTNYQNWLGIFCQDDFVIQNIFSVWYKFHTKIQLKLSFSNKISDENKKVILTR